VVATNAAGTSAPSASSNAVLVAAVIGPQLPVNIPTLNRWMLLVLVLLLIGAGALRLRRH
jgi:hypothetical protein